MRLTSPSINESLWIANIGTWHKIQKFKEVYNESSLPFFSDFYPLNFPLEGTWYYQFLVYHSRHGFCTVKYPTQTHTHTQIVVYHPVLLYPAYCFSHLLIFIWCLLMSVCWRRQWHPTPVLLPGKSHGQRSQVGCSPWGREESQMTERLHFHFSLCCIGGGNGNPLQCSCLENPRDGGAWWAAVYGVSQSWTWLEWLSSSNISMYTIISFLLMVAYNSEWM